MYLAYFLFYVSNSPILVLLSIPLLRRICEVCILRPKQLARVRTERSSSQLRVCFLPCFLNVRLLSPPRHFDDSSNGREGAVAAQMGEGPRWDPVPSAVECG